MRKTVFLVTVALLAACTPQPSSRQAASPSQGQATEEWYFWTDDGVRHYAVDVGLGPTVVVLHGGWGAEHSYLLDLVQPLGGRFRFVLYDQRGSLRSPAPDESISLRRLVDDLEHLRRETGQEKLTFLTHSMGSELACAYLKVYPERVRGMVMLSAVVPQDADTDDERAAHAHERFLEFAQANEARQVEREGLASKDWNDLTDRERSARNQISFAAGNLYDTDRWRRLKAGQAFFDSRVFRLLTENTPADDWAGLFEALQASEPPLYLIMPDHDLVDFGLVTWPHLAETLPNSKLIVIEQAGHNSWIDRPEEVQAAVVDALSAVTEND